MRFLRTASVALAGLCLTAMTLLTCAEIVMRYFFAHPIFGSAEIVKVLLGIAVFAGMFVVTLDRGHVNVSLLENVLIRQFGRGYIRMYDVVSLVGAAAVTGILAWKTYDLTVYPESTVVLRIPMIAIVAALAFLSAISILGAVFALLHETVDAPSHEPHGFE